MDIFVWIIRSGGVPLIQLFGAKIIILMINFYDATEASS